MTAKEIKETVSNKITRKYPINRSKYNVNRDLSSRTYKDVVYDSAMEMRYFIEMVEPGLELGLISKYERQKRYELQPSFRRLGEYIHPIEYVADYYIEYTNGINEVIDIKGMPDSVALIKRKLFWYKYPEINYRWITYNKSHGGWVDYDELQKTKRKEKREKEKAKKAEENKDNG